MLPRHGTHLHAPRQVECCAADRRGARLGARGSERIPDRLVRGPERVEGHPPHATRLRVQP